MGHQGHIGKKSPPAGHDGSGGSRQATAGPVQRDVALLRTAQRHIGAGAQPGIADANSIQRLAGNRAMTSLLRSPPGETRAAIRSASSGPSARPPRPLTAAPHPHVQRHASFEHRALGDIPPDSLFALGAQSDLASNSSAKSVSVPGLDGNDVEIKRDSVVHLLDQELRRLKAWQTTEPQTVSMDNLGQEVEKFKSRVEDAATKGHAAEDSGWNVRIVAIDSTVGGAPLLVTYGELNTLADFYGSVKELRAADPAKRRNVVQSVRQQSYEQLLAIYQKVAAGDQNALGMHASPQTFEGAFNITGATGEIGQMAKDKKGGSGTTAYMATLARNACHFAPESWHSWEDHHHQALQIAKQAHAETDQKKKSRLANEALLINGFGDHYLQDSYAAGHLINKTKIMQMYVRHLDRNPPVSGSYTTDPTWRAFQSMAYRQEGLTSKRQYDKGDIGRRNIGGQEVTTARNPQAVENTQELGSDFSWQDRFEMLGLKVPRSASPGTDSWKLLVWMQKQRGGFFGNRYDVNFTLNQLIGTAKDIGVPAEKVSQALARLVNENIVYRVGETRQQSGERLSDKKVGLSGQFTLRKEWVVSIFGDNERKFDRASRGDKPEEYERMAQATVYKEYVLFMRDAYLQKSTNAAHDYFCENGLKVSSGANAPLFKIYGDSAMMNNESSAGIKESAITSNMSRDAILETVADGQEGNDKTTNAILGRLPAWVEPPDGVGERVSLADWHDTGGRLEQWLGPNVFDKMNVAINGAMGVVGNLGKITEDENVHGGEAF